MNIGIIGLGLIGGSMGLDLKLNKSISKIYGYDNNENNANTALKLGLVDEIITLDDICAKADLIILAIPVNFATDILKTILDKINDTQIVTDVGSTKSAICKIAEDHPMGKRFVAGHPIAGTENNGPEAALLNLFQDKTCILCPNTDADADVYEAVDNMFKELGMHVRKMSPKEHDKHLAYVSHLSHISSFALGLTVLNIEKNEKNIFDLAGSGFESTVRLAKSSPDMWKPILGENSEYLLVALNEYIEQLNNFKTLIQNQKSDEVHSLMVQANEVRRVLEGK